MKHQIHYCRQMAKKLLLELIRMLLIPKDMKTISSQEKQILQKETFILRMVIYPFII